jgi:hypothetical protein
MEKENKKSLSMEKENKKSLSMKKGKRSEKNLDNTENFFF